jgi:hypothetical protein
MAVRNFEIVYASICQVIGVYINWKHAEPQISDFYIYINNYCCFICIDRSIFLIKCLSSKIFSLIYVPLNVV